MTTEEKDHGSEAQLERLFRFLQDELPGGSAALNTMDSADLAIKLLRERVVEADVPVFVLKGTDSLATAAISYYAELCRSNGSHYQASEVEKALVEMRDWQKAHLSRVKPPAHKHVPHTAQPLTIEPGHITPKE